MAEEAIDLVYTWVNAGDPELMRVRQRYAELEVREERSYRAGPARYRDNGELKYSLRSVERHLPFVRTIYIVCAGGRPAWLRRDRGDLIVVDQDAILPAAIIPTFQSSVVESFIYGIAGLAERYIYSNDDYFFSTPHRPEDFFSRGRSVVGVSGRFAAIGNVDPTFKAAEANTARAIGSHLKRMPVVSTGPGAAWLFRRLRYEIRAARAGLRLVNTIAHVAQPFLRSLWHGFHDEFRAEMAANQTKRFRSSNYFQTNFMFHNHARAIGKAEFVHDDKHRFLDRRQGGDRRAKLRDDLLTGSGDIRRFCLNDAPADLADGWADYVTSLLSQLFPNKSRWEI